MIGREQFWTIAAVALLATLIGTLHHVDRTRAERELRALEAAVCDVAIPRSATRSLAGLHSSARRDARAAELRSTAGRLDGRLAADAQLTIFFESDSTLWAVSSGSGPFPGAEPRWPQSVGRWESVAWAPGCRAVVADSRLHVARTHPLPGGRYVVLVATRWRDT